MVRSGVEALDDAGGVADGDDVGGEAFGDDAAGADDGVFADLDAGEDGDVAAEPDVVADDDGGGAFDIGEAGGGVGGVDGGVEVAAGAGEDVFAEDDGGAVEHDAAVVEEGAGAELDVAPVVAVEGLHDPGAFADGAEEVVHEFAAALLVHGAEGVVIGAEGLRTEAFGFEGGGVVPFPGDHFREVLFVHGCLRV